MKTVCVSCGCETFLVGKNSYSREIIPEIHHEIVCTKCGRGFVLLGETKLVYMEDLE